MQVTVEDQGKLKRKLSVEVPLADVQQSYDQVFSEIKTHVRVPGFRPGKFPRALAEKRFQSLMAQEAVQNLVPKYFDQALKEKDLRPATEPRFQNLKIDKKLPLTFDVEFEIFPAVELLAPSAFKLEDKPVAVTAEQVEARIAELRKRNATLADKGAAAAEAGDTVTFDFVGTLDGTPFPGGNGEGQRIEVGAGQFLKDFDAQFPGMKAGESKTFDLTFPADYGEASLAGKTVQFKVTAHKIEKSVPAVLNADFFKQFGTIETEDAFRDFVTDQLRREQERTQMSALQQGLADQIKAQYSFEVPESTVQELLHNYEHALQESNSEDAKDPVKFEALKEERRKAILNDMRLEFVIDAYARRHDLQISQTQLRERFVMQAYMMRQNPSELLKSSYGEQMLSQMRQQLLITKALGHLVHAVLGKEIPAEFAPGIPKEDAADHAGHDHTQHDHAHHDHDHEGHDHAH